MSDILRTVWVVEVTRDKGKTWVAWDCFTHADDAQRPLAMVGEQGRVIAYVPKEEA